MNVSEFVWHRLQEWGLKRVYGYPGDGVGGLDVALEKTKDSLQYIQVRHEEMAAFMAAGHAKFTGEVGLCYATSGPGAIHLLNGLYDAKMDHVPVVAIIGQQARSAIGAHRAPAVAASFPKSNAGRPYDSGVRSGTPTLRKLW
jgi:pyruvate dehydrogenase (quinone)